MHFQQRALALFFIIAIVSALVLFRGYRETFVDAAPQKPCAVYYTDNIDACDYSKYNFHMMSLTDLSAMTTDPKYTAAERDMARRVLAEKRGNNSLIQGKYCKINVGDYTQGATDPLKRQTTATTVETTERGPKEHWSFCFKKFDTKPQAQEFIDRFPTTESLRATPDVIENAFTDGKPYARVAVLDYDAAKMKSGACRLDATPAPAVPPLLVMKVNTNTMAIQPVANIRLVKYTTDFVQETNELMNEALKKLFKRVTINSRIYAQPAARNITVYRFSKNFCDKTILMGSYSAILDISRLGITSQYLGATTSTAAQLDTAMTSIIQQTLTKIEGKSLSATNITQSHLTDDLVYLDIGAEVPFVNNTDRQVLQEGIVSKPMEVTAPVIDTTSIPVYTISAWIRVINVKKEWRNLFFFGAEDNWVSSTTNTAATNFPGVDRTPGCWILNDNAYGVVYAHRNSKNGDYNYHLGVSSSQLPSIGNWFHYCAQINGNTMEIFIDGVKKQSATSSAAFEWGQLTGKRMYVLGGNGIHQSPEKTVYMQKLYWYNRILTQTEISALAAERPDMIILRHQTIWWATYLSALPIDYERSTKVVYTISFWLYIDKKHNDWRCIFFNGVGDNWSGWNYNRVNSNIDRTPGIWVYPDDTRIHFRHRTSELWYGFNQGIDTPTDNRLPLKRWQHYAIVVNDKVCTHYLNGSQITTITMNHPFQWNKPRNKKVFMLYWPNNGTAVSGLYVQRLYWHNRALSAAEITTLASEVID